MYQENIILENLESIKIILVKSMVDFTQFLHNMKNLF